MANQSNKISIWAICLSIVAIVLCLLVFALWIIEAIPHSIITADAFIGVCVALLGVIVTIGVGAQIINIMEVKSTQKACEEKVMQVETELKGMLENIKCQKNQIEEEKNHNLHIHHCSIAMLAELQKSYPHAICYYIGGLLYGMKMTESLENEQYAIKRIKHCLSKCGDQVPVERKWHEKLKKYDAEIRSLSDYRWIKEQYEPLRDEFLKKIGL